MAATPRPDPRVAQVAKWLVDFEQLERKHCHPVEWIMLKLSCTQRVAERLIAEAEKPPAAPELQKLLRYPAKGAAR